MTARETVPVEIHIGALAPDLHSDTRAGAQFLSELFASVPEVAPTSIGNHEPIRASYEAEQHHLSNWWKYPFLWKKRRPRVLGRVWMDDPRGHTCVLIDVQGRPSCGDVGMRALRTIAHSWPLDFGYVHASGRADLDVKNVPPASVRWRRTNPFAQGAMTQDIVRGLPGFCWAMLLGPPYVALFGVDRLRTLPAHAVEEIRPDVFLIQLTPTLDDYDRDREAIIQRGEEAMTHLGREAFLPESETDAGRALVPHLAYGRR